MPFSLEQQIEALHDLYRSERDPEGRTFAPLADAYRRAGRLREAMAVLREGLNRLPDFATGHVVAARLHLEAGLLAEAEVASRRALDLDPHNSVALEVLADALESRGAGVEADEVRARLAEILEPSDWDPGATGAPAEGASRMGDVVGVGETESGGQDPELDGAVVDIAELAPDSGAVDLGVHGADAMDVVDVRELMPDPESGFVEIHDLAPEGEVAVGVMDAETTEEPPPPAVSVEVSTEPDDDARVSMAEIAALFADDSEPGDADLPSQEVGDELPVVTRTLAELFVAQGLRERAVEVYRQLLERFPHEESFEHRLRELEGGLQGTETDAGELAAAEAEAGGNDDDDVADHAWHADTHADLHEVDTPFAWTKEEAEDDPPSPPISEYFSRLLSWEPGADSAGGSGSRVDTPDGPPPRPDGGSA